MQSMSKTKNDIKLFVAKWKNRGNERQDTHPFWEELVECLLGVKHGRECLDWEKPIPKRALVTENGKSPRFIDCYLKTSKCVIEQKSSNIPLDKPHAQSDSARLTALQQAQRYYDNLNLPDKGRYTIACNFQEFLVFDNNHGDRPPIKLRLDELTTRRWKYLRQVLLGGEPINNDAVQNAAAITASGFVSKLYTMLQRQYKKDEITPTVLHQLNVFCVRVVFCLYADDADIFENGQFHTFLHAFNANKLQEKFRWLFVALNQRESERHESYDKEIRAFPHVNGGLFSGDDIPIPRINDEIRELLLNGSDRLYVNTKTKEPFSWSQISPSNFGCIFESTLDPETREKHGMHYTSPENIHRVIDPLFLDELKIDLEKILSMPSNNSVEVESRNEALMMFRRKLASLRFLDPACGSGNFLTETFISLRRMEMRVLKELPNYGVADFELIKDGVLLNNPSVVNINQFYGIEINDFAVQVANTALWISDCQMIAEAEELFNLDINYLPLNKNHNIHCCNALEKNWEEVINPRSLNYIIGNPPFKGARGGKDSKEEKERKKVELSKVLDDKDNSGQPIWHSIGDLDYVCAWYAKTAKFMQKNSAIRAALVSTNSIVQGEQAILLWKPLITHYNIKISFAWRTFVWNNLAKKSAQVHCVIVGFYSAKRRKQGNCFIYEENHPVITCDKINNYLYPYDFYFINPGLSKPISNVPSVRIGNKPIDGGYYLFSKKDKDDFINNEPESAKYFHEWYGAKEFMQGVPRYCLWLGNCEPFLLSRMPNCLKRIEAVRLYRQKSPSAQTRKLPPTQFHVQNIPQSDYLVIPELCLQKQEYMAFGYMTPDILCSNLVKLMPNANYYHFGILESSIHMAWLKMVGGRMKSDYRYSIRIVYNNFPWPSNITEAQQDIIEMAARGIIISRNNHPESTLRQLYDRSLMPKDLLSAHHANDKAVFAAYAYLGIKPEMDDEEIATILLRESVRLISKQKKSRNKKKKQSR